MKTRSEIITHLILLIDEVSLGSTKLSLIDGETVILDLGIDSLDFAYIMISGETFVGGKVNENNIDWRNIRTINNLADVLFKCQAVSQ